MKHRELNELPFNIKLLEDETTGTEKVRRIATLFFKDCEESGVIIVDEYDREIKSAEALISKLGF